VRPHTRYDICDPAQTNHANVLEKSRLTVLSGLDRPVYRRIGWEGEVTVSQFWGVKPGIRQQQPILFAVFLPAVAYSI
jgi:hypothetical protein